MRTLSSQPASATRARIRRQLRTWRKARLTYANLASTLALVLALGGGSAYAASRLISGSQITPGSIGAKQIRQHSLLGADFKPGQLPSGPQGPTGGQGPQGPQGPQGVPGTAAAWGLVVINSVGNPTFVTQSGFPGTVTQPQPGFFCVAPPAGFQNVPVLVSAAGGSDTFPQQVSGQDCGGNQYEIKDLSLGNGQGFTIAVP